MLRFPIYGRGQTLPFTTFRTALPWTLFVMFMFLLNYGARTLLSPLLVAIESDLGISHDQSTSLLLLQATGFSLSLFASGFLLSRVRPRTLVAVSSLLAGTALLAMTGIETFTGARMLLFAFGMAAGLYFTAGISTLESLVRPADWGKAVAIHELAPNGSFILVPLIAEAALRITDWQGTLVGTGAALIAGGVLFLLFGRGGTGLAAPPSFRGMRQAVSPLTFVFTLFFVIGVAGEFATYSVLPLHMVNELGYTPEAASRLLSLSRLGTPLSALCGGWVADTLGARRTIKWYLVLHGLALMLMGVPHQAAAVTGMVAQGMFTAFVFPAIFKMFAASFAPERQPLILSVTMPFSSILGTGIIPWLLGLCGQYLTFAWGFVMLGALSLVSVLGLRVVPRDRCP